MPWLQTKDTKHIHWITEERASTWSNARDSYKWMLAANPNLVLEKILDEGIFTLIRLRDKTTYIGRVHVCHPNGSATLSDVRVTTYDREGKRNTPVMKSYVQVHPRSVGYVGALERCPTDCVETLDRIGTRSSWTSEQMVPSAGTAGSGTKEDTGKIAGGLGETQDTRTIIMW